MAPANELQRRERSLAAFLARIKPIPHDIAPHPLKADKTVVDALNGEP
ncbi:hypothetical protein [Methylobacterium terricola]|nr:hypothetical protein [Methylobacterium terricola]